MKSLLALVVLCGLCQANERFERAAGGQNPKVFSALDQLRGGADKQLSVAQIQELFLNAKPGQDFPLISELPKASNIDCGQVKPGFYADADAGKCQIFNRCDVNGNLTSYLCPNMTIFNQITLVCDWWFNVDCSKAKDFYDYSNSRLYTELVFLDDENDYVMVVTGAVAAEPTPAKSGGKKSKKAKKGGESAIAASGSADVHADSSR